MKLSTKLSLGLDKSILGTLKLPDIDLHIIEEIKQSGPTIQVLSKPKKKLEIRDTEQLF